MAAGCGSSSGSGEASPTRTVGVRLGDLALSDDERLRAAPDAAAVVGDDFSPEAFDTFNQ